MRIYKLNNLFRQVFYNPLEDGCLSSQLPQWILKKVFECISYGSYSTGNSLVHETLQLNSNIDKKEYRIVSGWIESQVSRYSDDGDGSDIKSFLSDIIETQKIKLEYVEEYSCLGMECMSYTKFNTI